MIGLAAHRPDALDPAPGQPGAGGNADEMPSPVAAACWSTIDELAWMCSRPELERIARRGCPSPPGARSGDGSCRCAVLDRPPPVDRYRPSMAQRRLLELRDRTCRHPGCGQRVGRVDLDHVVPHGEGGQTDCDNLCCLCRRHHRLKTFAPGWRVVPTRDGRLRVTTPSGITRTTRPPGLRDRIEQRALPAPPPPPQDPPPF